jgi:hypothetical protein
MNVRALSTMAALLAGVRDCSLADPEARAEQLAEAKAARRRVLRQINTKRVFADRNEQNEDSYPTVPQKPCDTSYLLCIRAPQNDSSLSPEPIRDGSWVKPDTSNRSALHYSSAQHRRGPDAYSLPQAG